MRGTIAVAQTDGGIEFSLSFNGQTSARTGVLNGADSARELRLLTHTVVVGDYGLLQENTLSDLFSTPMKLRIIAPLPPTASPMTAEDVLHEWLEGRSRPAPGRDEMGPYLRERRFTSQRVRLTGWAIEGHLRRLSPAYAKLLSHNGSLDQRLFNVAYRYPTPGMLRDAGPLELNRRMIALPGSARRSMAQALVDIADHGNAEPADPALEQFTITMVRGLIDEYRVQDALTLILDESVFNLADGTHMVGRPRRLGTVELEGAQADFELASGVEVRHRSIHARFTSSLPTDVNGTENLLNFARLLEARLHESPCPAREAYALYKSARAGQTTGDYRPAEVAELERIGQRLSLPAGDIPASVAYRDQARAARKSVPQLPPHPDEPLVDALTACESIDLTAGGNALRSALESGSSSLANPYLLTEAQGFMALLLAMVGQRNPCMRLLDLTAEHIAAHSGSGSSRAASDIARLLLAGMNAGQSHENLESLRSTANLHSEGTAYRSYFHYAVMVTSYITGDIDMGLKSFASIRHENRWAEYGSIQGRAAQVSYAILLAAAGKFGSARAELQRLTRASQEDPESRSEIIIHQLLEQRISLAAGIHDGVLDETSPSGPLATERVRRTHPRYLPASLCLRGSAMWRAGMEDHAVTHFRQAVTQSVFMGDFTALAVVETEEFRNWFLTLDRNNLPAGIPTNFYDEWLSHPALISGTLPALTPQQSLILHRLAVGRSAAAIAAELKVSPNTMKTHMRHLYRKLGASSRQQCVTIAEECGLIS